MSDVAQILGVGSSNFEAAPPKPPPPVPSSHQPPRAMKLLRVPREVKHLIGGDSISAELPTQVPAFIPKGKTSTTLLTAPNTEGSVKVGSKWISKGSARKWVWAPFSSSSRTDGAIFYHWVRGNVEYPDYPYARFDIHMDPLVYTDEEYDLYLQDDQWSKSETDLLLQLARQFELRWPVIHDRWLAKLAPRKIEDLQHRYYHVAAKLMQSRIAQEAAIEVQQLSSSSAAIVDPSLDPKAAAEQRLLETAAAKSLAAAEAEHQPLIQNSGTGASNKTFDLEYERERRAHWEALWCRSKAEELEEVALRQKLKQVEAQLRKIKKAGGHILAGTTSASSSRNPSRPASPAALDSSADALDPAFLSTAPVPTPGTPYLQSARLVPPATGGNAGINKSMLTRMDQLLIELGIPPNSLVPTKRMCDLFDTVRKELLTLLILQKSVVQQEGSLQSKRLKLAKMGGGTRVMDEETLLGITPPPSATTPIRGKSKTMKPKADSSSLAAAKATGKPDDAPSSSAAAGINKEAPVGPGKQARKVVPAKRKRKEPSKSPGPVAAVTVAPSKQDEGKHAKKRAKKS